MQLPASLPPPDPARVRAMVDRHHGFVWRQLCRMGVPEGDADDATQQVFLTALPLLHEVAEAREAALLVDIVRKIAANTRRKASRRSELGLSPLHDDGPEAPSLIPPQEEQLDHRTLLTRLDHLLGQMPEEQREVFVLFELEGMALDQVSELLGVPRGTVASRIRLARERIQRDVQRLRAQGYGALA